MAPLETGPLERDRELGLLAANLRRAETYQNLDITSRTALIDPTLRSPATQVD